MVYVWRRNYKTAIFFCEIYKKKSKFNFKDRYVLVCVKIAYYHKNMPYISQPEPNFMKSQIRYHCHFLSSMDVSWFLQN